MDNFVSRLDEIDQWLFDTFCILPGCCSSAENLRHSTARMIAEALWTKKNSIPIWKKSSLPFNFPRIYNGMLVWNGYEISLNELKKLPKNEQTP